MVAGKAILNCNIIKTSYQSVSKSQYQKLLFDAEELSISSFGGRYFIEGQSRMHGLTTMYATTTFWHMSRDHDGVIG